VKVRILSKARVTKSSQPSMKEDAWKNICQSREKSLRGKVDLGSVRTPEGWSVRVYPSHPSKLERCQ
jgi:hypothetical protein